MTHRAALATGVLSSFLSAIRVCGIRRVRIINLLCISFRGAVVALVICPGLGAVYGTWTFAADSVPAETQPALPASVTDVHTPICLGRPPCDAICGLVRLEDGEIRHYDYGDQVTVELHNHPDHLPENYIFSRDDGLTWQSRTVPPGHLGADARSPVSGEYMRLLCKDDGVYVIKSKGGIDGQWTMRRVWETKIAVPDFNNTRTIVFIRGGRRALCPFCTMRRFKPDYVERAGTLYSDDDGETWKLSKLITDPPHHLGDRDKSPRWQNYAYEPTLVELHDGRIWMIFRTSTDNHFQSFSSDGGVTWDDPTQSPFFATCTTPTIGRLADGRLLFLWNNTTPFPEFPKNEFTLPYLGSANDGNGEDMFNNRDAVHAAISDDDGKTWRGFRELYLNPHRNDHNYGDTWGIDRSVHQSQFVEVGHGRILVSVGQHWLHRSLLLFDPAWLYETERRSDFSNGLTDWSVQGYSAGIHGHCALDRFESSSLVSQPNRPGHKALQVRYIDKNNVLFHSGGATWNFPAGKSGTVQTRIRLSTHFGGARISLLDRWLNPVDPTAHSLAMCCLEVSADGSTNAGIALTPGVWHDLTFQWNGLASDSPCELIVNGQQSKTPLRFVRPAMHGISYIHYQSSARTKDDGFLIESVSAKIDP